MTDLSRAQFADDAEAVRNFILAGNATFTIVSKLTGKRFTYKVSAPSEETERGGKTRDYASDVRFVSVLTGSNNETDYSYLGTIKNGRAYYYSDRKARIAADAPSAVAFAWFWKKVWEALPTSLEIWHEGVCGRCGHKLTDPASIASGYGPECIGKVGLRAEGASAPARRAATKTASAGGGQKAHARAAVARQQFARAVAPAVIAAYAPHNRIDDRLDDILPLPSERRAA